MRLTCNEIFFRVLLRVRMLYYIKHEIIGDYVHQIQDGIPIRYATKRWLLLTFLIFHQLIRFHSVYFIENIHSAI